MRYWYRIAVRHSTISISIVALIVVIAACQVRIPGEVDARLVEPPRLNLTPLPQQAMNDYHVQLQWSPRTDGKVSVLRLNEKAGAWESIGEASAESGEFVDSTFDHNPGKSLRYHLKSLDPKSSPLEGLTASIEKPRDCLVTSTSMDPKFWEDCPRIYIQEGAYLSIEPSSFAIAVQELHVLGKGATLEMGVWLEDDKGGRKPYNRTKSFKLKAKRASGTLSVRSFPLTLDKADSASYFEGGTSDIEIDITEESDFKVRAEIVPDAKGHIGNFLFINGSKREFYTQRGHFNANRLLGFYHGNQEMMFLDQKGYLHHIFHNQADDTVLYEPLPFLRVMGPKDPAVSNYFSLGGVTFSRTDEPELIAKDTIRVFDLCRKLEEKLQRQSIRVEFRLGRRISLQFNEHHIEVLSELVRDPTPLISYFAAAGLHRLEMADIWVANAFIQDRALVIPGHDEFSPRAFLKEIRSSNPHFKSKSE